MGNWANGYNTDLTYIPYFLRELSPQCIDLALLKSGYLPPSNEKRIYCELGCGLGYTSLILAACYPDMTFYAVDFNSEHIARAKEFVKKANLKNVHFFDLSFGEFAHEDLPKFDYMVAHGIWTWVSAEVRNDIKKLVSNQLNTGGVFYVSYNCMPGNAPILPLQRMYYQLYKSLPGNAKERISKTIEFVDNMIEKKAAYFEQYPTAKQRHQVNRDKPVNYFAHEYLNANWDCFYINEVCNDLDDARVKFVGSANLSENATTTLFEKEYGNILPFISDIAKQEQLKDYAQSKMFRKDLFMRGAIQLSGLELVERINKLRFCIYSDPTDFKSEVSVDGQKIKLPPEGHKKMIEVLAKKPMTFYELQQQPILSNFPFSHLFQMISCSFEAGQIAIMRDDKDVKDRRPAERLNKAILEQTQYNLGYNVFAVPEFGYGVECGQIEQIFLKAIREKIDPVEAALNFLKLTKETLRKDGKPIKDPGETQVALKEAVEKFRSKRLKYFEKIRIAA